MASLFLGGIELLEPDLKLKAFHNHLIEQHFIQEGISGEFTDPAEINRILQGLFAKLESTFASYMRTLSSRALADYFLFQNDQFAKVVQLHKDGKLSAQDEAIFEKIGPSRQLALRFIVERIVLLGETEDASLPQDTKNWAAHRMFACAEEMVNMYVASDQSLLAFPEHSRVIVTPGSNPFFSLKLDKIDPDFGKKVKGIQLSLDEKRRLDALVDNVDIVGELEVRRRILNTALKNSVGADFDQIQSVLLVFTEPFTPPPGQKFPIPFCHEDRLLDKIAAAKGLPRPVIDKIVEGMVLTKEVMGAGQHVLWKPKSDCRSFSRPLLRYPHETGRHITFSPEMVKESLNHFNTMLAFGKIPKEWETPGLRAAVTALNREITSTFEKKFGQRMQERGIIGLRAQRSIGTGSKKVSIPGNVGEIDYIGYMPRWNVLMVIECKLAKWGSTPKDFYEDRQDFIDSLPSYSSKFLKKVQWVRENNGSIFEAMKSVLPLSGAPQKPSRLAHAIVTFYPTPVSLLMPDLPCASFVRFCDAIDTAQDWPYSTGIELIK